MDCFRGLYCNSRYTPVAEKSHVVFAYLDDYLYRLRSVFAKRALFLIHSLFLILYILVILKRFGRLRRCIRCM